MRRVALVVLALALAGACGSDGNDDAEEPDCPPSTTDGEPAGTTTTLDPRCVVGGEENEEAAEGEDGAEVWEGTITGEISVPDCTPPIREGELRLEVDETGNVAGSGTLSTDEYTCQGAVVPADSVPVTFTGTKTDDRFVLNFAVGPQELTITGNTATGEVPVPGGTLPMTFECVNCE